MSGTTCAEGADGCGGGCGICTEGAGGCCGGGCGICTEDADEVDGDATCAEGADGREVVCLLWRVAL